MSSLIELKSERKDALDAADRILKAAESTKRKLTDQESQDIDVFVATANRLSKQIEVLEAKNTITQSLTGTRGAKWLPTGNEGSEGRGFHKPKKATLSDDYATAFYRYIATGGQEKMEAVLYEGSQPGGGYAVPIVVDDQIVPLAPQEMGVRTLATVIPTTSDIKFPIKAGFGTAAAKAENSAFGESDMTLGQFTLSAFMAGIQETLSWGAGARRSGIPGNNR